ncbi:sugar kinase [Corynebacterium sp. CCM 9185]|uniref:Sugar kinase n=1 Tax=Corynebacterium marambiense TaxID=2765364 RepID=A0ABS0VV88_9CORY|nr:sugar kinase [Corynebacterium marambiense]MBI9000684.1 sugar kinase [Corynebacterium marambiense]MCK7663053.1 sugar kinase [Corynebacterium marambiense]MCX7542667.1 sugar kinase [Corynebacterium marambiense]
MFDITSIGEGQIRLTVIEGRRLVSSTKVLLNAACSEANVCGVLSQLGRATSWCSILPEGDLAERCLSEYRSVGVDLSNMIRVPEGRTALYFMEPGKSPMPSRVTYDRQHTPFRDIRVDDVNWDSMLDTKLVFVTGITASLTDNTGEVITHFVNSAADRGIDVVLDVNYRGLLWSPEKAAEVLTPLAEKSTALFCSRRDAEIVFGITGDGPGCARTLRERFGATYVVSTDQTNPVYYAGPDGEDSVTVETVPIVDRPGAGDSFVAGCLHGFLSGDMRRGVEYGKAIAKYALTHHGDLTRINPAELSIPTTADIIR